MSNTQRTPQQAYKDAKDSGAIGGGVKWLPCGVMEESK